MIAQWIIAGIAIGVLLADTRFPRLRVVPLLAAATIAVLIVLAGIFWLDSDFGLIEALTLTVSSIASGTIYSAARVKQLAHVSWAEALRLAFSSSHTRAALNPSKTTANN